MPNPEHLAVLKQGVAAWNEWRRANSRIILDLTLADLREADLYKAALREVGLRRALEAHISIDVNAK